MFLFRASRYLDELKASGRKCLSLFEGDGCSGQDLDFCRIPKKPLLRVQMSRSIMPCLKIQPMLSLFRWMRLERYGFLDFALGCEREGRER